MDFYKKIFEKSKSSKKQKSETKKPAKQKTHEELMRNMASLKQIVTQPKELEPNDRSEMISKYLEEEEANETIKIERWHPNVYCPKCKSTNIIVLNEDNKNKEKNKDKIIQGKRKYKCKSCNNEFSDDTDTPIEHSSISMQTWMECWYLLGITDSLDFIAAKLNLDITTIRVMVRLLQRLFRAQQPLTKFVSYDDWYGESSYLQEKIKEQLVDKFDQLLGKIAVNQAKDTREETRQQERRRGKFKPKW